MSENGSGFDWMSIFFLVIAGIVSLFQAFVKKKTQTPPIVVPQEKIEEECSSTEDYFLETRTVEGYSNSEFEEYLRNNRSDEIVSGSDYYQAIETKISDREVENIDTLLHNIPQVESPEPTNFNLKEAVIYSEVLKRKY